MSVSGCHMSQAVGVYLKTLMNLRGLDRTQVAAQSGVDAGYTNKVLKGEIKEPSLKKVRRLCSAVKGQWEHIGWLINDKGAREGQLLAEALYQSERGQALTPEQRSVIVEMMKDPEVAAAIVAAIDARRGGFDQN